MRRMLGLLVAGMAHGLFAVPDAAACSCLPATERSIVQTSPVVLEGRVVQVQSSGDKTKGTISATIRVTRVVKGPLPDIIVVETNGNSAACGVRFQTGEFVRFGASRAGGSYRTGLCSQY
jgi:hypothetical protein